MFWQHSRIRRKQLAPIEINIQIHFGEGVELLNVSFTQPHREQIEQRRSEYTEEEEKRTQIQLRLARIGTQLSMATPINTRACSKCGVQDHTKCVTRKLLVYCESQTTQKARRARQERKKLAACQLWPPRARSLSQPPLKDEFPTHHTTPNAPYPIGLSGCTSCGIAGGW